MTAIEPDPGESVGSGAILKLKQSLSLDTLNVFQAFGENLPLENENMDAVYMRQALHHAHSLPGMMTEAARITKKGGYIFCLREDVVFSPKDKEKFLENHPLQAFYDRENAFTLNEYTKAFSDAGLSLVQVYKYFDSPINYYPLTADEVEKLGAALHEILKKNLAGKIGPFSKISPIFIAYKAIHRMRHGDAWDERRFFGRMYSFIIRK